MTLLARITFVTAAVSALAGCNLTYDRDGLPFTGPTIKDAVPITIGVEVAGKLDYRGDRDFWSFDVPSGGRKVRFQTFDSSGGPTCNGIDPKLQLLDANGALIVESNDTVVTYCEDLLATLDPGSYYVVVENPSWINDPPTEYRLRTTSGTTVGTPRTLSCHHPAGDYCDELSGQLTDLDAAVFQGQCGSATYAAAACPSVSPPRIPGYCDTAATMAAPFGPTATWHWIYYGPTYSPEGAAQDCVYYLGKWIP